MKKKVMDLRKGDIIDMGGTRGLCEFELTFPPELWGDEVAEHMACDCVIQAHNIYTKSTHNQLARWEEEVEVVMPEPPPSPTESARVARRMELEQIEEARRFGAVFARWRRGELEGAAVLEQAKRVRDLHIHRLGLIAQAAA